MMKTHYKSSNRDFTLLEGDCIKLLPLFNFKFDMIFADPPYFLSNDGISVQSGKHAFFGIPTSTNLLPQKSVVLIRSYL